MQITCTLKIINALWLTRYTSKIKLKTKPTLTSSHPKITWKHMDNVKKTLRSEEQSKTLKECDRCYIQQNHKNLNKVFGATKIIIYDTNEENEDFNLKCMLYLLTRAVISRKLLSVCHNCLSKVMVPMSKLCVIRLVLEHGPLTYCLYKESPVH